MTTPIPAISIVGKQNSGKTTLLERLIRELAQHGLNIGTVKHHSHTGFGIDIEGKDSWRHRQAGSIYTVVAAPDQIAHIQQLDHELELEQIIALMTAATTLDGARPLDLILVEGYRQVALPTIDLFRAANPKDAERDLDLETYADRIIAVVTDIERVATQAEANGIPIFALDNIQEIAVFIEFFIHARIS